MSNYFVRLEGKVRCRKCLGAPSPILMLDRFKCTGMSLLVIEIGNQTDAKMPKISFEFRCQIGISDNGMIGVSLIPLIEG